MLIAVGNEYCQTEVTVDSGGLCFWEGDGHERFSDAEQQCRLQGGTLALLDTPQKLDIILSM